MSFKTETCKDYPKKGEDCQTEKTKQDTNVAKTLPKVNGCKTTSCEGSAALPPVTMIRLITSDKANPNEFSYLTFVSLLSKSKFLNIYVGRHPRVLLLCTVTSPSSTCVLPVTRFSEAAIGETLS